MKNKVFRLCIGISFMLLLLFGGTLFALGAPLASEIKIERRMAPHPWEPIVRDAEHHDVSPALRDMKPITKTTPLSVWREDYSTFPLYKGNQNQSQPLENDLSIQDYPGPSAPMPAPLMKFDGVGNVDGVAPPDTQGDIGYDPVTGRKYYVQWVNLSFAVWDVTTGTMGSEVRVYGPVDGNTLWQGFGGPCETSNDGDPITLFDPISNRWFMSQFALPNPYYQCIAVSKTADPTGEWYRYAYRWIDAGGADLMNDYPKFGVWPDGYYMTVNQFGLGGSPNPTCIAIGGGDYWCGAGVAAFERDKMLQGQTARMVYFDLGGDDWGGMLPSDLDGLMLPEPGTPNFFVEAHMTEWDSTFSQDELAIYEFAVDWSTPVNSTFTQVATLPTASIDGNLCNFSQNCIPQPNTQGLDAIAERLMYRLAYRNFGTHSALVTNLTVDADGNDHAGVHWFELRNTGSGWSIYQEGTYAPDAHHRWMGSVAQDGQGNMALGYSVSSNSLAPSIRYAGRLVGDPLGVLPQAETELLAGSAAQSNASRWGDYSMMGVDPTDDCTFWYTQQYSSGGTAWRTHIGAFRFPNCGLETGVLTGSVTFADTGMPVSGAQIQAALGPTYAVNTTSAADGTYKADLLSGTYTITTRAYGAQPSVITDVVVNAGITTTQNITLTKLPAYTISGTVRDAIAGWPLYAHLQVDGEPVNPPDPYHNFYTAITGTYAISLVEGITYTFFVDAVSPGYSTVTRSLTISGDMIENFELVPDLAACEAPGYQLEIAPPLLDASFDDIVTFPGGGWAQEIVVDEGGWGPPYWGTATEAEDGTSTTVGFPHSGTRLAFFDAYNPYAGGSARLFRTNGLDLRTYEQVKVSFWVLHYVSDYVGADRVELQVSTDGGSNWTSIGDPIRRDGGSGWTQYTRDISTYTGAGMSDVRIAFLGTSGFGHYVHIDDVSVIPSTCLIPSGGLVIGNVYDANTTSALPGATVSDGEITVTTGSTPDPAVDDGFFTTYAPAGSRLFTATMPSYGVDVKAVNVVLSDTVVQDFMLPAAQLGVAPTHISVTGGYAPATAWVTLTNSGGWPTAFELQELGTQVVELLSPGALITVPASQRMVDWSGAAGASSAPWRYPREFAYEDPVPPSQAMPADVLLVYADEGADVLKTVLATYPDIDHVDLWNAQAGSGSIPGLKDLLPYDVVITWNNYAYADSQLLGDVLADYVDIGGRVIVGAFTQSEGAYILRGRFLDEAYLPLRSSSLGNHSSTMELGDYDDAHPIMQGVQSVSEYFRDYVSLDAGALLVARWRDGEPFIATKGNVVSINAYPGDGYQWLGDMGIIFHNAVNYLLKVGDVPWLSLSPVTGTISPHTSQLITLTLDSDTLDTGVYRAQVRAQNDAPYAAPTFSVTLTAPTYYTLTVAMAGTGSGMVEPFVGARRYAEGATVILTATADFGSSFAGWSGDIDGTTIFLPVLMDRDKSITATFDLSSDFPPVYLPLVFRP